jgi:hypothetical protein
MQRTRDREDPGGRAATLAAMAVTVAVTVVTGVGVGAVAGAEAVAGRRRLMSADVVGSWAIGPGNVGPRRKRSKPISRRMRRPR